MEGKYVINAARILKKIQYMTIATVCSDGSPWNTPVAPTFDDEFVFHWGSNEESVHSKNVRNEKRVFVVIYDSTAPSGTGEGVYMSGEAQERDEYKGTLRLYTFRPDKVWINDEEQDEAGNFKKDVRIEINIEALKAALKSK